MNRLFYNYDEFVDKFKVKKTTDDCYTPDNVFNAILDWAVKRWGIDRDKIVRPFYPGGDYEHYRYDADCMVFDNPPFSIISKIVGFYEARKIRYFLFCPTLTSLRLTKIGNSSLIVTNTNIEYANGAKINTSFVTNLENSRIIVCSELKNIIGNLFCKKQVTKYVFPHNVVCISKLLTISRNNQDVSIDKTKCLHVEELINKNGSTYRLFGGGGYLVCNAVANAIQNKMNSKIVKAKENEGECIEIGMSDVQREAVELLNRQNDCVST